MHKCEVAVGEYPARLHGFLRGRCLLARGQPVPLVLCTATHDSCSCLSDPASKKTVPAPKNNTRKDFQYQLSASWWPRGCGRVSVVPLRCCFKVSLLVIPCGRDTTRTWFPIQSKFITVTCEPGEANFVFRINAQVNYGVRGQASDLNEGL